MDLEVERVVSPVDKFAIVGCLSGQVSCAGISIQPGEFFLVPSSSVDRVLKPLLEKTTLLRVVVP